MQQHHRGLLTLAVAMFLAGCGTKNESAEPKAGVADFASAQEDAPKNAPTSAVRTLAYSHHLKVVVAESRIAEVATSLQTACTAASSQCSILGAEIDSGDEPQASLHLRATASEIVQLRKLISGEGKIISESTSAEDLAEQMTDNAKRLDMLLAYRQQLEQLRGRAASDIAALLQVQRELAQVQADVEQATGQKAYFERRVNYDILDVEIASQSAGSGLRPVREAATHFLENLASATGGVISAIAFLLPWAAFLTLAWWVVRPVRRWWRARRAARAEAKG